MGQQSGLQEHLFYAFRLDDRVPVDHLLRKIDAALDLTSLCHALAPFYGHTGWPSIDPELMIRMLLVGYCYGCGAHVVVQRLAIVTLATPTPPAPS